MRTLPARSTRLSARVRRALLLLGALACGAAPPAWAQVATPADTGASPRRMHLGARLGLSISQLTFDEASLIIDIEDDEFSGRVDLDKKLRFGFVGGLTLFYDVSRNFTLESRFLYTRLGSVQEGEGVVRRQSVPDVPLRFVHKRVYTLDYLNIPVLVRITVSRERSLGYVGVGPQVGVLLSSRQTTERSSQAPGLLPGVEFEEVDLGDATESLNVGILFLAGAELRGERLRGFLEVAFALGLSEVYTDVSNIRTRAFEITVGFGY
ncbi:MAG: PorT family protein [Candidatus Latescibacterota bacterium]|nr:MAG: PorT family protein [Candidatus Latescibacterota bacterium]